MIRRDTSADLSLASFLFRFYQQKPLSGNPMSYFTIFFHSCIHLSIYLGIHLCINILCSKHEVVERVGIHNNGKTVIFFDPL